MKIIRFEDIVAWQKAQDLAVEIYAIFRNSKDCGFKDQICRATISVSNCIAEGLEVVIKTLEGFCISLWLLVAK